MEIENKELKTMPPYEATQFVQKEVRNAYYLKSRAIPENLGQMVDTLKAMLLKYMPHVTTRNISEGIEHFILHETTAALSVDMLFKAVKSKHTPPYEPRDSDIEGYRRPDLEGDTISLLDTCASMLAQMDAHEKEGVKVAKHANVAGVVIPLPAFNPRREFDYLKMRGQVTPETAAAKLPKAIEEVNLVRIAENHNRVKRDEALKDPDVQAMCRRLAVLDWLRSCNTRGVAPSAILAPLVNESQYQSFRRTTV